jgi:hypothetical protein
MEKLAADEADDVEEVIPPMKAAELDSMLSAVHRAVEEGILRANDTLAASFDRIRDEARTRRAFSQQQSDLWSFFSK